MVESHAMDHHCLRNKRDTSCAKENLTYWHSFHLDSLLAAASLTKGISLFFTEEQKVSLAHQYSSKTSLRGVKT